MSLRLRGLASVTLAALLATPAVAADVDVFALTPAPDSVATSALDDATPLRVILSLPLRDAAGARRYGAAVSDPTSPLYGRYLTPAAFAARFGASVADYQALRSWAASAGLQVGPVLDSRAELSLGGTAGQFAALFGTHFLRFPTTRGDGYTVRGAPHLPTALQGRVEGVIGLTSPAKLGLLLRTNGSRADVGTGQDGSGYAPADLVAAYDVPAQGGTATEKVAVFEQDGFRTSDLATYESTYGLAAVSATRVGVDGSSSGIVGNGAELEADLDLDMLVAMNPRIAGLRVYIDNKDSFQTALLDAINQVAQDNVDTVFSISYGQDEVMQGTAAIQAENKALLQLQTQGISVFVSAGDDGAAGRTGSGKHAADPCSQPLVTCVGGTALKTVAATQHYVSEVVWNNLASGNGATGGGVSSVWSIPSWQVVGGVSVAKANGGSSVRRNVPDIAADAAYPNAPVSVYSADNGGFIAVGGTSASAPIWAGWASIFNGDASPPGGCASASSIQNCISSARLARVFTT